MSQPMQALEESKRVRQAQLALKIDVEQGNITIEQALVDSRVSGGLILSRLLSWQRQWANTSVERLCEEVGISTHKLVRDLTDRQRAVVVEWLSR